MTIDLFQRAHRRLLLASDVMEALSGDPGGFIVTILIGVAGAFIGGFIGAQLGFGDISGFDLRSMGLAIAGALILLFGYRMIRK